MKSAFRYRVKANLLDECMDVGSEPESVAAYPEKLGRRESLRTKDYQWITFRFPETVWVGQGSFAESDECDFPKRA